MVFFVLFFSCFLQIARQRNGLKYWIKYLKLKVSNFLDFCTVKQDKNTMKIIFLLCFVLFTHVVSACPLLWAVSCSIKTFIRHHILFESLCESETLIYIQSNMNSTGNLFAPWLYDLVHLLFTTFSNENKLLSASLTFLL